MLTTPFSVPEEEPAGANALLIDDVVIIPELLSQSRMPGFPSHTQSLGGSRRKVWRSQTPIFFSKTQMLLEQRGFRVQTIDLSELQKAEAGVTCDSLIVNDNEIH